MEEYKFIEAPTPELISALISKKIDPHIYADWLLLFDEYNKATNSRKSMVCRPCYGLVYNWYKEELYKSREK